VRAAGASSWRSPWGAAQPHRDELGLLFPIEQLGSRWGFALLAVERALEAVPDQALPDVLDRFRAAVERLGNARVRPARSVGVGLEQHLRPPDLLRRAFQLLDDAPQSFPLLIREADNLLFLHGNTPWLPSCSLKP